MKIRTELLECMGECPRGPLAPRLAGGGVA